MSPLRLVALVTLLASGCVPDLDFTCHLPDLGETACVASGPCSPGGPPTCQPDGGTQCDCVSNNLGCTYVWSCNPPGPCGQGGPCGDAVGMTCSTPRETCSCVAAFLGDDSTWSCEPVEDLGTTD
jgi:hypothetical protein